jgi:hypothetical protein
MKSTLIALAICLVATTATNAHAQFIKDFTVDSLGTHGTAFLGGYRWDTTDDSSSIGLRFEGGAAVFPSGSNPFVVTTESNSSDGRVLHLLESASTFTIELMVSGTCTSNPHYVYVSLMEGVSAAYDSEGQLLQSQNTLANTGYQQYVFEEEDITFISITTPGNETFIDEIYVECD